MNVCEWKMEKPQNSRCTNAPRGPRFCSSWVPEHWVAFWASQDTLRPKLDLLLVLEHIHGLVSSFLRSIVQRDSCCSCWKAYCRCFCFFYLMKTWILGGSQLVKHQLRLQFGFGHLIDVIDNQINLQVLFWKVLGFFVYGRAQQHLLLRYRQCC